MGYARYTLRRAGREIEAGYDVPDRCNRRWCWARIDRGLDHLCGRTPGGDEHGCGGYFCDRHLFSASLDVGHLCPACRAAHWREQLGKIADVLAESLAYRDEITDADVLADHPAVVTITARDGFGCYARLTYDLDEPRRLRRGCRALPRLLSKIAAPIRLRRAEPCGACADRGWFYTVGTAEKFPPPDGCSGVAVCGCGAAEHQGRTSRRLVRRAHRRNRSHSRMGAGRRLLLAVTFGRAGRGAPPF
ncbi:hypothetical protein [Actinomadura sp. WMMA1423]|uniref:hypothetical protein n=1 Tax=Actinomadura sp. WMMA1423 TaxID=2591108 RepID=UPI001146A2D5|nr:hypothetical protein [Actinomadura sp. WMMA1423]